MHRCIPHPRTVLAVAALAAPALPAELYAVRAEHLELGDGTSHVPGVLIVEDGRVRAAGGADVAIPEGTPVIEHDGWLTPGLVAFSSHSGAFEESTDSTRSFLPEARVAIGLDPGHADLEDLARGGITTTVLSPQPTGAVPGRTALLKSSGELLRPDVHLMLVVAGSALQRNRAPTSYAGLMHELEEHLSDGEGVFAEAAAGDRPVLLVTSTRHDALRALQLASRHGLRGALTVGELGGELADALAASGLGVVIDPIGPGEAQRSLDAAARLAAADVPLAFALHTPRLHADGLRWTAATCVRHGMDRAEALAALTSGAALLAGAADRVGRLAPGLDADFVLWSGDPLELTSAVRAVYVDGRRLRPTRGGSR